MKPNLLIAAAIIAVLVLAAGIGLYNWVLGTPQAASAPINAPTLAVEAPQPATRAPTVMAPVAAAATAPVEATQAVDPAVTQAPAMTEVPAAALPATGLTVYQISQADSEARFNIYELLRGAPKDVIGRTSQVAGEVALNPADLSSAQIGEILINARTLATDDDRRNNAIRNRILSTDQYEYISFKPTQITGLSGSGAPGQPYSFQVTGDLTIRDVTKPVTFDVTVTAESPERISGSAKTSIQRADFNLNIPNVPFVANVGEAVALEINFVLLPK